MSKPTRVHNAGTYFVTTSCWERRRIFQVEGRAELFLQTVEDHRSSFLLHAYVVMPDHIHLLLTPREVALERALQYVKGGFSHALNQLGPKLANIWQRGFTDHRIRDIQDFERHRKYIEENPVAARLVERPEDYPWSSASVALRIDPYLSG